MPDLRRNATDTWVPLIDYAIKKGISLSTLRRHIKANKITYKVENGRYLLLDHERNQIPVDTFSPQPSPQETDQVSFLKHEVQTLKMELRKAQEEIVELKTLIALYEENIPLHRLNN